MRRLRASLFIASVVCVVVSPIACLQSHVKPVCARYIGPVDETRRERGTFDLTLAHGLLIVGVQREVAETPFAQELLESVEPGLGFPRVIGADTSPFMPVMPRWTDVTYRLNIFEITTRDRDVAVPFWLVGAVTSVWPASRFIRAWVGSGIGAVDERDRFTWRRAGALPGSAH